MTCDGGLGNENHTENGDGHGSASGTTSASDMWQNNNDSSKNLGFGLVDSRKQMMVSSVHDRDEDEDAQKDKKMRPLVPIDYLTEELLTIPSLTPGATTSNLAAAAEFATLISGASFKEDKPDVDRERSRYSHDRSSQEDRNGKEKNRTRYESRSDTSEQGRDWEHRHDKKKTPDNQKLLDSKQSMGRIPKTKEELFSYKINLTVYDENELHDGF